MNKRLALISGINKRVIESLSNANIKTTNRLLRVAVTSRQRKELAERILIDENTIYTLTKIADLMQIPEIDEKSASMLVGIGIRSVDDLKTTDVGTITTMMKSAYRENPLIPGSEDIIEWKLSAKEHESKIEIEVIDESINDKIPSHYEQFEEPDEFFCNMTDVIINLGTGIAEAQQKLDEASIRIQQHIFETPELRDYGFMASWYTMPEVTLNLKMNYAIASETKTSGSAHPRKRIMISPINARYQNFFKTSQSMESELNLKIVPVPPPGKLSEVIHIPDLTGKTLTEAKNIIDKSDLFLENVKLESGEEVSSEDDTLFLVTSQDPMPGEELQFKNKIRIVVKKVE